jgi:hypothetical protein
MNVRKALATGTMAILLVGVGASCSTTRAPEPLWNTWTKPAGPADSGGASYDAGVLAQEWRELEALRSEVLELNARIASLSRAFRDRPVPRASQELLDRASWLMLRHLNARDALLALRDFFASATPDQPTLRLEGGLLGLHAGIYAAYLDTRLVLLSWGNLELIDALDAASPALGVEPGTFRAIRSETTTPRILDQMRMRRSLLDEALVREESALLDPLANDHALAPRQRDAMRAYDDAMIQAQLVLYRNTHPAPEATSSAQPGRIARWWGRVGDRMGRDAYSMQGFVFTKVARIKSPRAHLLVLSSDDVRELRSLLQPGDLILTFTDGWGPPGGRGGGPRGRGEVLFSGASAGDACESNGDSAPAHLAAGEARDARRGVCLRWLAVRFQLRFHGRLQALLHGDAVSRAGRKRRSSLRGGQDTGPLGGYGG